jgi:hypothetical protein
MKTYSSLFLMVICVLLLIPLLITILIAILLKKNHVKFLTHKVYYPVKVFNGIAIILVIYSALIGLFQIFYLDRDFSLFEFTTTTNLVGLFYYVIFPLDLIILFYFLYNAKRKSQGKKCYTPTGLSR